MKDSADGSNFPNIRDENKQFVLRLMSQFDVDIPDEEAARASLYQYFEESGLTRCPYCPDSQVERLNYRLIRCRSCGKQNWITAGTFFHGVRCVRPYLASFYLRENGAVYAASWFAKLLNISGTTGALITKKIGLIINKEMTDDTVSAHSIEFIELICRRSRETPAGEHPRAELNSLPAADGQEKTERIPDKTWSEDSVFASHSNEEQAVLRLLESGPLDFDSLCMEANLKPGELSGALTVLELKGLIEKISAAKYAHCSARRSNNIDELRQQRQESRVKGDRLLAFGIDSLGDIEFQANANINSFEQLLRSAQSILKQVHGGLSRKCLQIYAGLFWCHMDRRRWGRGTILKACFRHPPIQYEDIVAFVSPPFIRMVSQAEAA